MLKKPKKTRSRKTIIKSLDTWFSRFIRLRDADNLGICECITCGKRVHWKKLHAGHFIRRGETKLRWNEKNVHAQCVGCNKYRNGKEAIYGLKIIEMYGNKFHKEIIEIRMKKEPYYIPIEELKNLEDYYKNIVKENELYNQN